MRSRSQTSAILRAANLFHVFHRIQFRYPEPNARRRFLLRQSHSLQHIRRLRPLKPPPGRRPIVDQLLIARQCHMTDILVFLGTCAVFFGTLIAIKPPDWQISTSRFADLALIAVGIILLFFSLGINRLAYKPALDTSL